MQLISRRAGGLGAAGAAYGANRASQDPRDIDVGVGEEDPISYMGPKLIVRQVSLMRWSL